MADVFRPRLPIDPFAALDATNPWHLQPLPAAPIHPARHIVLVLGAPTYADLAPLASSPHLASSLLVLATHTPPPLDRPSHSHPGPSILILHLPAPLAVHDAGAVRLVSLLERAQRAAAAWAAAPAPRIQQFGEDGPGGEFVLPEEPEVSQQRHTHSAPRSPSVPNPSPLNPYATGSSSPASSFTSLAYTLPHSKPKPFSKPKKRPSGLVPFTGLLSFLPSGLPEKSLLKHAILVTTLSAPFLSTASAHPPVPVLVPSSAASVSSTSSLPRSSRRSILAALPFSSLSLPASAHPQARRRSRLSSLFSASSHRLIPQTSPSVDSLSSRQASPPACKPHLVHVLPYSAFHAPPPQALPKHRPQSLAHLGVPGSASSSTGTANSVGHNRTSLGIVTYAPTRGKTKLVQSIEQFLLSFAYPVGLPSSASREGSVRMSGSGSGSGLGLAGVSSVSGSGLRGSRTAPSSPSRTAPSSPVRTSSPAHGFPPPLPPPSSYGYPKSQSTSALARPASAPSSGSAPSLHNQNLNLNQNHKARTPSSASSSHKARAPSSSASSISSAHPRSRPTSTYSTYSAISGISGLSVGDGDGGGKGKGVVPYIVPVGVMGCYVSGSEAENREGHKEGKVDGTGKGGVSVGEAVVLGLLDVAAAGEGWPRAWIGDARDAVWGEEGDVSAYDHAHGYDTSANEKGKGRESFVGTQIIQPQTQSIESTTKSIPTHTHTSKRKPKSTKQQKRVRRNEAGLPTPPESSSSLDSASEGEASEDDDGFVRVRARRESGSGSGFESEGGSEADVDGETEGCGSEAGVGRAGWDGGGGVVFPVGMGSASAPASVDGLEDGSERERVRGREKEVRRSRSVHGDGRQVERREMSAGTGTGNGRGKKNFRTRVSSFFGIGGRRDRDLGVGVEKGTGVEKGSGKGKEQGKTKAKGVLMKKIGWGRG